MDPLAHTLVGATLAESGLRRTTPLATATLVIGANLPDVDFIATAWGRDTMLHVRRGLTHGILGVALLPAALAVGMILFDRVRRSRKPHAEPARFQTLLALSYLAVLTHPALDWLNNYGVRLLSPFDDRWFYGDALFIIDPWLWLMMGAAVVLARSRAWLSGSAWIVLGASTTALVTLHPYPPMVAKVAWIAGVAGIVWLRWRDGRAYRLARAMVGISVAYIVLMIVGSRIAGSQAESWLMTRGMKPSRIMAGPLPANPFVRDVIAVTPEGYRFYGLDWLRGGALTETHPPLAGDERGPVVQAALDSEKVRGFRKWMRFPSYEVEKLPGGYRVTIRDVRYSRYDSGIGTAVVELDEKLDPR
ncbi:MAG TPA: metal-dependent hydrolase [Polyangiales bacterium]|nr:metal-dependent hydrolase [Polyangiales bacterium]